MYVLPKEKYEALINQSQSSPIESPVSPNHSHSTSAQSPASLCPVGGRDFLNPNTLAHHMKSHVSGHKCNICGKVFKHARSLRKHLLTHRLQAKPPLEVESTEVDMAGPAAPPRAGPAGLPSAGPSGPSSAGPSAAGQGRAPAPKQEDLHCDVCNKKVNHKRNLSRHMRIHKNTLKFKATKWETLS